MWRIGSHVKLLAWFQDDICTTIPFARTPAELGSVPHFTFLMKDKVAMRRFTWCLELTLKGAICNFNSVIYRKQCFKQILYWDYVTHNSTKELKESSSVFFYFVRFYTKRVKLIKIYSKYIDKIVYVKPLCSIGGFLTLLPFFLATWGSRLKSNQFYTYGAKSDQMLSQGILI